MDDLMKGESRDAVDQKGIRCGIDLENSAHVYPLLK